MGGVDELLRTALWCSWDFTCRKKGERGRREGAKGLKKTKKKYRYNSRYLLIKVINISMYILSYLIISLFNLIYYTKLNIVTLD